MSNDLKSARKEQIKYNQKTKGQTVADNAYSRYLTDNAAPTSVSPVNVPNNTSDPLVSGREEQILYNQYTRNGTDVSLSAPVVSYEEFVNGGSGTVAPTPEVTQGSAGTQGGAATSYQAIIDQIEEQYIADIAKAEKEQKDALEALASQKQDAYSYAELLRAEAEERAKIARQRAVVDARSGYEQNKASYGANAEAMSEMGLTGSGYSDYLNSRAYAQQRADTQAANAQYEGALREAFDAENQAKLAADATYSQSKYNVESDFSDKTYQIETNYRDNITDVKLNEIADTTATAAAREAAVQEVYNNYRQDPSYYTKSDYDNMVAKGTLSVDEADKYWNDQNRRTYNDVVDIFNSGNIDDIGGALKDVEILHRDGNIDKQTYDEIQGFLNSTAQGINYQYDSGKITVSEYVDKMLAVGVASSNKIEGGWFVRINNGYNNLDNTDDTIDITVGSTNRNKNAKIELLRGEAVVSSTITRDLNKLATGRADSVPTSTKTSRTDYSSEYASGKLVCYNGKIYLYENGWTQLLPKYKQSDADDVVFAFLKSAPTSDIESKAVILSSGK